MTSCDDRLLEAAERLWDAQASGFPCAPVRDLVRHVADAYAVQQHNVARNLEAAAS